MRAFFMGHSPRQNEGARRLLRGASAGANFPCIGRVNRGFLDGFHGQLLHGVASVGAPHSVGVGMNRPRHGVLESNGALPSPHISPRTAVLGSAQA